MITVTSDLIEKYIQSKHASYNVTVDICDHMRFHIDGYTAPQNKIGNLHLPIKENPYFMKLIDAVRPGESDITKMYRRSIYIGKTKTPCGKVINSLKKIVKSKEWDISYNKAEKSASIRTGEDLQTYTEKNYPFFGSLESWLVNFAMKENISDPNSLIAVLPIDYNIAETDIIKPYAYIITSEKVLEYKEGEIAVFITENQKEFGHEILTVTKNEIWSSNKNSLGKYIHKLLYTITWNEMPVFRSGGIYKAIIDNSPVYLSMLDAMLQGLDTAAREVSDYDAEKIRHMHSQMWYYSGQDCKDCNGTGKAILKEGKQTVVCGTCKGNGVMSHSPYVDMVIKAPQSALGEQNVPTPPAGYIEKNTNIVEIQAKSIKENIYDALSAVNMEFLAESPLNVSGESKKWDRSEATNFFYGVASHYVVMLKKVLKHTANYRYHVIITDYDKRMELLPSIPVPDQFDMLTSQMAADEIKTARDSKMSPLVIAELELEYAEKEFSDDDDIVCKMRAVTEFSPFIGYTPTELNELLLSGGVLKIDYIKSVYLPIILEQLYQADNEFYKKDYETKNKLITDKATEILNALEPAVKVITDKNGNAV